MRGNKCGYRREEETYEEFVGFVMEAIVMSRVVLLTTSWMMALTTGKSKMKVKAMPRQAPMMLATMNQRRL